MNADRPPLDDARAGLALLEVIIAMTLVLVILPGVLLSSALAARDLQGAGEVAEWSAAVQHQMESVVALGYRDVADGSAEVGSHGMSWTVTDGEMKLVQVVVSLPETSGKKKGKGLWKNAASADTLWVFLPASDSVHAADYAN